MFQPTARSIRLLVRCLFVAVLLALSIAVPSLSPRCGFASEKPSRDADAPKETKTERPPFDLTYLPPDAMGVIAIRPSAIFSDPAMKMLADMANEGLEKLQVLLKLADEPKLRIEDIEEVIIHTRIVPSDKKYGHNHSLMAGLTMVRAKHDCDWLKVMRQLDPKIEEVRHEDRVYYRSHFSALICIGGALPNGIFCYYMPDKRTLAFLSEKNLSAFVKGRSVQRPHFSWDEDWKRVEHGLIAVATDNRWTHGLSKEQLGELGWASLAQNAATMVAGADWKGGMDIHAYLTGKDRAVCDQMRKDIKLMLAQLRDVANEQFPNDMPEWDRKAAASEMQVFKDVVEQAHIQQRETMVHVHTKIKLAHLARFLLFCLP